MSQAIILAALADLESETRKEEERANKRVRRMIRSGARYKQIHDECGKIYSEQVLKLNELEQLVNAVNVQGICDLEGIHEYYKSSIAKYALGYSFSPYTAVLANSANRELVSLKAILDLIIAVTPFLPKSPKEIAMHDRIATYRAKSGTPEIAQAA